MCASSTPALPREALLAIGDKDTKSAANEGSKSDKRKQSLYFPEEMLEEIKEEAARLDRSLSWIVQRAWKIARVEIKRLPSVDDILEDEDQEQTAWRFRERIGSRIVRACRGRDAALRAPASAGRRRAVTLGSLRSCATVSAATGTSGSTSGMISRR